MSSPLTRRQVSTLLLAGTTCAQELSVSQMMEKARLGQLGDEVWVCPMDADVRSHNPGSCPRCGMALKAGLPEQAEYHLDIETTPKRLEAGKPVQLRFRVLDPWKHRPVTNFQVIHEKFFHLFLISTDLEHFEHVHPERQDDGSFLFQAVFPRPGVYRVLSDFYPDGATPQLLPKTLIVPGGAMRMPKLVASTSSRDASNVRIAMRTVPEQPLTGQVTQMHFELQPGEGIEKYLGAWGHMLAASDDLIDLTHTHPFIADGGPGVQFNLTFARTRPYRVWVQFQRQGVVNTAHFDVTPQELR